MISNDKDRQDRVCEAMRRSQLDVLVCALPSNVLLLTGYWPVIGDSVAIMTSDGEGVVIAPEDERFSVNLAGLPSVDYYHEGRLNRLARPLDGVRAAVLRHSERLRLNSARIGIEVGPASEPTSYIAMNLYMDSLGSLLREVAPRATLLPLDPIMANLKSRLTAPEVTRVREACALAAEGYATGLGSLMVGQTEIEAASHFELELSVGATDVERIIRSDGMVSCMSGARSARAFGAYAICSRKKIQKHELVLTHCNSQVAGYWTDITRTYFLGTPDDVTVRMYDAIQRARLAGLRAIRPGVPANEVDHAVRDTLAQAGFGDAFKHGTGHGVGFAAIDHRALPRIHPASPDRLEEGMVFNVEPAIYLEDRGMRHCDMVIVSNSGCELLTDFQSSPESWVKN